LGTCWYMFINEDRRDVVDKKVLDTNPEIDLNGWDIKKAVKMLRESNCGIIEWLYSPIMYTADPVFLQGARELVQKYASWKSVAFHYLNQAKKHLRDYFDGQNQVIIKKYFYVVRPLLCTEWIRQKNAEEMPPPLLQTLLDTVTLEENVSTEIKKLTQLKIDKKLPIGKAERIEVLDNWITVTLVHCEEYAAKQLKVKKLPQIDDFNLLIAKTVFPELQNKET